MGSEAVALRGANPTTTFTPKITGGKPLQPDHKITLLADSPDVDPDRVISLNLFCVVFCLP